MQRAFPLSVLRTYISLSAWVPMSISSGKLRRISTRGGTLEVNCIYSVVHMCVSKEKDRRAGTGLSVGFVTPSWKFAPISSFKSLV